MWGVVGCVFYGSGCCLGSGVLREVARHSSDSGSEVLRFDCVYGNIL